MTDTPNLGLPLLAAAQAQKHVTHNEALSAIDVLLHCAVVDKDLAAPPGSPASAARYIVASPGSGAWAGHVGTIAAWQDGAWTYRTPKAGFIVFVLDESLLYVHTGSAWIPLTSALSVIQNLALLGIGTSADATNPLSAKLNKTLWTAKTAAEGGTGDLRYTLNKEAAGNVLSLLFQSGYSGRLEFGLIGSDNPALKVSPNGSSWTTALSLDATTGGLDFLAAATDVASAATIDLGAQPTLKVRITGTTAITSLGPGQHRIRFVEFLDALTLTHNATSLILPAGATIVTAAGDTAILVSDGSGNWRCRHYQRANGQPIVAPVIAIATPTSSGAMSAADKLKLNALDCGAGIIPNGNFDSSLDGWSFSNGGLVGSSASIVSAADARSGTKYAVIDLGATGPQSGLPCLAGASAVPVEPGSWLEILGDIRADAASPAQAVYLRTQFYKPDGTASTMSGSAYGVSGTAVAASGYTDIRCPALTTSWQSMGGLLQVPADATQVIARLYVSGSLSTARYHHVDGIYVRRATGNTGFEPIASGVIKGRASAGTGLTEDLSASQVRGLLALATTDSPTFAGLTLPGSVSSTLAGGGTLQHLLTGEGLVQSQWSRHSTDAVAPIAVIRKARGSIASPAPVTQNDAIGSLGFSAHTGSAFVAAASLAASVIAPTPSGSDMQSRLTLQTVPSGSVAPAAALLVESASVRPGSDNTETLGTSAARWSDVISVNLTVDANFRLNFSTGYPTINFDSGDFQFFDRSGNSHNWYIAGLPKLVLSAASLAPGSDNALSLGSASARWSTVYAGTGTISTSDQREKTALRPVADLELDAWGEVSPGIFQYLDAVSAKGEGQARLHAGYVAQAVESAFRSRGLDPSRHALWCADPCTRVVERTRTVARQKSEIVEVEDEVVEIVDGRPRLVARRRSEARPAVAMVALVDAAGEPVMRDVERLSATGDLVVERVPVEHPVPVMEQVEETYGVEEPTGETRLGLRYDQCAVLEAAWQRRRADRLEARIATLEARYRA